MNDSVALFVNLETLAAAAPATPPEVSLGTLMAAAQRQGHLSIRRAFGDVNGGHKDNHKLAAEIKSAIAGHLLQVEHIPVSSHQSALVSIRLAIEALGVAYTVKSVNCFVFVGINQTVAPLLGKLRELGHRVVVFADAETCDSSSVRLISNECISFASLTLSEPVPPLPALCRDRDKPSNDTHGPEVLAIVPSSPVPKDSPTSTPDIQNPVVAPPPPPVSTPASKAMNEACMGFCMALDEVLRKGRKPVVSAIAFEMARLYPAMNLAKLGLRDADALAVAVEKCGHVRLTPFGNATLVHPVSMPKDETAVAAPPTTKPPSLNLATCRSIIKERLKCALPALATRRSIYEHTAKVLTELWTEEGTQPVTLLDLSSTVATRLAPKVDQPTIFKVLFTLLISNSFLTEQMDPRPHTILIKKILTPVAEWDASLIRTCIGMIAKQNNNQAPAIETLCLLFEISPSDMVRIAD